MAFGGGRRLLQGVLPELPFHLLSLQDEFSCHYNPQDNAANCTSLMQIQVGNETALEQAVATVGPVSIAVDASTFHFRFYKSGIKRPRASLARRDHGDNLAQ